MSSTTLSSNKEYSIGESDEGSWEIMGIILGDSNRDGLQDNPSIP